MKKALLLTLFSLLIVTLGFSQTDKFWSANSETRTSITTDKSVARLSFPKEFKLFNLNIESLRQELFSIVGSQARKQTTVITLPNAAGGFEEFEVNEASNFEPSLQAKFPEIRAYSGRGITDRYATLKLSISPQGIQTMIFRTEKQNEFIEAYSKNHDVYAVFTSSREKGKLPWTCTTEDKALIKDVNSQIGSSNFTNSNTGELKTMRLAQSCNGEYSNYFGAFNVGQIALTYAAFNATLSRCNGVYEKDLALHLNLIANSFEQQIIFFDPATDPYTTLGMWNGQLQNLLNTVVGDANYDIGHMFGASGGGGNAGCIGCVCVAGQKGSGITSPADNIPMGDNFDIDYVVHEVGHQLGGNHTFSFSNEGTVAQKEVGAGITIMGYAGITSYDPAPHSIDIFHQASIAQIQTNLATKTCPVTVVMTANHAPVITALSNFTIPISTPFALTGSATDQENDPLTYCWEQDDVHGGQTAANSVAYAAKLVGPNWLSFPATASGTRLFPKLSTVQAGLLITPPLPGGDAICNIEALSSVGRILNFKLTVRDNHAYVAGSTIGQTQAANSVVTVDATSGPFQVTSPNTNVSWAGGSSQTVTWTVNNTTAAPVSCANVKISLSTDGGATFPTVLLASTANDGTEALTIPNTPSTTARIKVEAVGNIFYDMSNTNFIITGAATAPVVTINQAAAQADPTSTSPINFTVVFDQAVTGFTAAGVTLSGTAGATTKVVTGGPSTYNVAVSGMVSSGTVIATIPAGVCQNASAQTNNASTSTDNTVTYTLPAVNPNVTINQAAAQADPTGATPINFTVVFDQPVSGFTTGDVTIGGTAGATTGTVTGGPTTYNVAVSGMTGNGTVVPTIAAGVCQNAATNPNNASTSTDNSVTYNAPPGCTSVNPVPSDTLCSGSTHAAVTFSSPTAGTTFSWTNNTPSIGLAASGTGNLPAFVATNATAAPVVATIIVTPTINIVTPTTTTFNFTGGAQTFTVPAGVSSINITTLGAEGGAGAAGNAGTPPAGGAGGRGSRATGTLAVTPGQVLTIFVGGAGGAPTAGFNGGGTGGNANSGGGGGASDVRFPGASSVDRILVAGGGAGGGRGGCEGSSGAPGTGGAGGNGDGNGVNGGDSPTPGGVAGGGAGAIGVAPGGAGIGCAGFLGAPGLANAGPAGGNGGGGQTCCCFSFASVPGGGGGGGGFLGGAGGGGGSAGTVGCSGNDKGAGGGGAGGTSYTGGVTAGAITTNIQTGNGQVVLNYNIASICNGPTSAFTITVNPTPTVNAVPNQTVCAGAPTAPVNFTGTPASVTFNWTNNNTAIGLGAAGTGNIPSFIATNTTNAAITGTITVTPQTSSGSANPGGPVTFTNPANIAIPASGTGSGAGSASNPYPSNITVSGLPTTGVSVQSVTLTNITHTWSDDIGVLLVGPNGEKFVPMARVGGSQGFDVTATVLIKDGSPLMPTGTAAIPSGNYGPTARTTAIWPAPAPIAPYNYPAPNGSSTFANTFNTTSNYNGTWSLYVTDMAGGDIGNIAGGWGLTLVTPATPGLICTGTPRTFTITVNPNPAIVIIADPSTTICEGDPTLLTVVTGTSSGPGVLYSQTGASSNGSPSQVFEPVNTAFNSQAADDFTVPAATTWGITQITANGTGNGTPTSVNVFFYANSGSNLPGAALASFTNISTFTRVGGNYTVTLPSTVNLAAGTYWMSFQVNMPFAGQGQWFWANYGAPNVGNEYAWQNPGGGFATPCTNWGYGGTGCNVGGGAANRNNIFSVTGSSLSSGGPLGPGYTFLWSPALGLSSTTSNPVAASPMNTTTYTVVATTAGGCTRTATVLITVNKRPTVTTQPAANVRCVGTTATFTVGATGTGLVYQWQESLTGCPGTVWTNLTNGGVYNGVNTATLTVGPVTALMNGRGYRCVVTGACAPIGIANISNCALLTVNPLPVVAITPPISCGGVAGISGTQLSVVPGGANNSYVWSPLAGLYNNSTATSAYTGTNTPTVYAAPTAFTVYTVTATDNVTGCTNTATAFVNYTPPAPTVTPSSVTMCLGDPAVRLVSSSSSTTSVQFCSGPISVIVPDNNLGGSTSNLTVSGIPATCNLSAMSVTFNMNHTWDGDVAIALKAPNGQILNLDYYLSNTGGTGATTGFVNTKLSSAGSAALSSGANPYTGTFKADASLAGAPPAGPTGFAPTTTNWNALYSVPNGTWTLGMVDAFGGDQGTLTSWCIDMTYVCGTPSTPATWSPIAGLFNDAAATIPYAGTPRDTVWTRPTPSGIYTYQVTVQSLPVPPLAFANPAPITISNAAAAPANPYPATINVSGLPTTGVTVKNVTITGLTHTWAGDVNIVLQHPNGTTNVILMANSNADPLINVSNVNLAFSDAATASVPATAPIVSGTYLPTNRNGATFAFFAPGPVVTGPTFPASPTLSTFTGNMNGTWKLFVEDKVGGDGGGISGGFSIGFDLGIAACTSPARTVVVTVNTPTSVTTQPVNQTICTDKVATFTVVAGGSGPFTYQWQVSTNGNNPPWTNVTNGGVYSGATTATLTITAPPVSLSGNFYRVIINGAAPCASATSFGARLIVNPLPTVVITAAPYTSLFPGLVTTLSSTVSPFAAATYTWLRNGVVVSGATTGTLSVNVDGLGDYQLRVTDVNGCTNSSNIITIKDSASGKCFIYPNPTSGQFQVRYYSVANNVLPRGIVVYDAKGDRVLVKNYTIGRPYDRMDVDMRANGKGLYWVEIVDRNGNRLTMCRVVIQ